MLALEKLGNQKFSAEPGGYTFSNWMASLNTLLDDFEEKTGYGNLPKEYHSSRQRLTAELLKPVDTVEIDTEIEKAESEMRATEVEIAKLTSEIGAIRDSKRKTNSEIDALKRKRTDSEKELGEAMNYLSAAKKKQKLISRIFSGKKNEEIDLAESKVDSVMKEQKAIDTKVAELEGTSNTTNNDLEDEVSLLRQKLAESRSGLAQWVERKEQMMQLSELRITTTSELSGKIAALESGTNNDIAG